MARQESDREDLLREAVALVRRVELRVVDEPEPVTAGYRRNGALSLFFGADPVWQFNTAGELRRGYVAGKLLKAEAGRLVELTRVRTAAATELVPRVLDAAESQALLRAAAERIAKLRAALTAGRYEIVGQVPPDADVVGELSRSSSSFGDIVPVARSPRVGD